MVGKSARRWLPRRASASAGVDYVTAKAGGDEKTQRQRRQNKRDQLKLTAADLTTVGAGGGEAKTVDNAGKESARWWSPQEWWKKARSARLRQPSRR